MIEWVTKLEFDTVNHGRADIFELVCRADKYLEKVYFPTPYKYSHLLMKAFQRWALQKGPSHAGFQKLWLELCNSAKANGFDIGDAVGETKNSRTNSMFNAFPIASLQREAHGWEEGNVDINNIDF
jgi:hypothetical protein